MDKKTFDLLVKFTDTGALDEELISLGYDSKQKIEEALEPYRVKRAIIMAAGFGSRMVPITYTTPKPLVRVNGVRFIDTLLSHLVSIGIKDIIIVRGYLKNKFDELLEEYPFIKFIDNDLYDKENNISSAIKAVDYIDNTYICEADFFITGNDVLTKYQYESNYIGTKVDSTDDWCFDVDQNDIISNYRKGGVNCVQAFGISYWNHQCGLTLQKYLKEMYKIEDNKQKFWEMCIFEDYKDKFSIKCRYVKKESIVEIDSFDELVELDASYENLK